MHSVAKKLIVIGVWVLLVPGMSWAIPFIPTVIPQRQSPTNPPADGGLPGAPPTIEQEKPPQAPNEAATKIKFVLKKVTIEGNKTFTYEQLEPVFKAALGKEISLADLQMIAAEIEKFYVMHGYILTRVIIPPQEIDASGSVKLQVVEGYISGTVINGDTKHVKKLMDAYLKPVLDSKPLQVSVLERAVLLINDIPGITTKAVLTPSFDTPGASTLVLVVNQVLFSGTGTWDDRGVRYEGPNELSTVLQLNNIFEAPGQLEFDGKITTTTSELRSGNLQYTQYVFDNGSTFMVGFSENEVKPGSSLAPLKMVGTSNTTSVVYTYPFIRTRRMNLSGNAMYTYLNSLTYFDTLLLTIDRIESIRFGGTFNITDDLQGMNMVTAQYSQGIQFLSGDEQPEIYRSSVNGQKNYSKVTLTYTRLQNLPETWSFFFSAAGQLAFNSLLTAEQIGYGGAQYGSAYDPSEIIADSGFEGKAELRYNSTILGEFIKTTQYYASYDFGALYNKNPILDAFAKQSGTSAALGLRVNVVDRLFGDFQFAQPLTRKVAAYDNKDIRFFFSLTVDFAS